MTLPHWQWNCEHGTNPTPCHQTATYLLRLPNFVCILLPGNRSFAQFTAATELANEHSLFNGQDLTGWHADVPEMDKNPDAKSPFLVRDGMLVSLGTPGGHSLRTRSMRITALRSNIASQANRAIAACWCMLPSPEPLYGMFPQSLEVQMESGNAGDFWCIREDITVPNMEERRGPKENWGTEGDKLRRIKNLTDDSEKPVGEWNTMVIECRGNTIKVWVNGDLVNDGTSALRQRANCNSSRRL